MMARAVPALLGMLSSVVGAQQPIESPAEPASEVAAWVEAHAVPLSGVGLSRDSADLEPLMNIIGDSRLVGFGEGMHNTHEFWAFRNRLFAYLVEELGFTAIALETGYLESIAADDYVQGKPVDRDVAAQAVFSWSPGVFAENRELLDWMRSYNAGRSPDARLRLYGLEMLACGEFDGRWMIEPALAFLAEGDPQGARELQRRFEPVLTKFNEDDYAGLSDQQKLTLLAAVQDLVSLYERGEADLISRKDSLAYERAYHLAIVARQLLTHLRMGGRGRDSADAQNLRWVLEKQGPRGRVFVFAHNGHLAKQKPLRDRRGFALSPMGEHLQGDLKSQMIVIGSLFDRGLGRELFGLYGPVNGTFEVPRSRPDSLNGALARVGPPLFLLDLRRAQDVSGVPRWLTGVASLRDVAGYDLIDVRASFDALLFVREISPQRLVSPAAAGSCFARRQAQERAAR